MANKWIKVGAVLTAKKKPDGSGGNNYIKFTPGVDKDGNATGNLTALSEALAKAGKDGLILNIQNPRTSLDEAVKAGRMDADKGAYLKGQIPEFVKFELFLVEKG